MDPVWWLGPEGGCWGPTCTFLALALGVCGLAHPKRAAFNGLTPSLMQPQVFVLLLSLGSVLQGPGLPCRGKCRGLCRTAETERDTPVLPGQAGACLLLLGAAGMMGRGVVIIQPSKSLLLELCLCLFPVCSHLCPAPASDLGQDPTMSCKTLFFFFLMEVPVPAGAPPPWCRKIPKQLCLVERQVRTLPSRSLTSPSLRARCRQILSQGDAFRWLREVCRQANQILPALCVSACPP